MNLSLAATVPLQGILSIYKITPETSKLVFSEENLITLASKQYLLSGLYTSNLLSDPINQLKVGTGGSIDPQGLFPRTEDPNWSNLTTPLLAVSTTYTTNTAVPSVTFLADLDQGTGNGSLITEAGLFKVSGGMFNIKCFPGIPKTSEFALHFEWTIKFA